MAALDRLAGGGRNRGLSALFFAGVARTGVATGTLVAIGSAPILAGLLGIVVLRERPSRTWLVATVLAVGGCSLLITAGGELQVDALGILLALGAGASYAGYTIVSKELPATHAPDAVIAVLFCGGALMLAPLLIWADLSWLVEPRGMLVALHLGLVATALAYVLYIRGLLTTPVSNAVSLALAEPLTAALLGIVVLGERLPPSAWLGIGLIFGGLALLTIRPGRRRLETT